MPASEHEAEVMQWRAARELRLRASDGWLTLVDRLLLDDGDNVLPFGGIDLRDGVARVRVTAGLTVTRAGQPFTGGEFVPRENSRSETLAFAGRTYELYRRGDVVAVRVKDPESPALRAFTGLEYFPIDPAWRIVARFERYDPPRTTVHQLDIGPSGPRTVPGLAHFSVDGRALTLEPVLEEDSRRLFFVFADQTTGRQTSPAGRFLYAPLPTADGSVTLDFNVAFNPPCAFTPHATCPIPPARNRLPVPINAGERTYAHVG